jgi:hypothetical protein
MYSGGLDMRVTQAKQNTLKEEQPAGRSAGQTSVGPSHPLYSASGILQLQKTYGNRYVTQLVKDSKQKEREKQEKARKEEIEKKRNGIKKVLFKKYRDEYDKKTAKAKKKQSVKIPTTTNFKATADQREEIQGKGEEHGCHSCGTFIDQDSDQPWIGDHIPPTNLDENLKGNRETFLHPQCSGCAHQQATLVKSVNSTGVLPKKGTLEYKLLFGGNSSNKKRILSSGSKVTADEGEQIQELGTENGCHSCGTMFPASEYIADHFPPVHMYTPSSMKIQEELGYDEVDTDNLMLLPQCPKCSSNQGGTVSHMKRLEDEYRSLK